MQFVLDPQNPCPFKYPLLCLVVQVRRLTTETWHVDVDGQIDKYLTDEKPTELLISLRDAMASRGYLIVEFGQYTGSAGPSHILRNGAFFTRMSDVFEKEPPLTFRKHW